MHRFDADRVLREIDRPDLVDPVRPVGLLVGNTRALWAPFLAARRADASIAASNDPLQRYAEQVIGSAAAARDASVYYSHTRYDGAYLPFQRIAVAAGLAALAPTHLLVHPTYGPWFALRAMLLCTGEPPRASAPVAPACEATCGSCLVRFEIALAATGPDAWRAWLAVRDACPVGREHRYGDDQLAYHYTKDPRHLG